MSEMIIIQGSQIQEITKHGFHYLDDIGNDVFVDFEGCYQNYLSRNFSYQSYLHSNEKNPSNPITLKNYIAWFIKARVIGRRNNSGDSFGKSSYQGTGLPYITFFTNPITIIEFESQNKYGEVWATSRRNHWHLSDET